MMTTTAVIAIGYNKVESLLRLLESLNRAEYDNEQVPLIISIDNSGSTKVEEAAKSFKWKHGEKEIRTFEKRQGLKGHILSCGDFLKKYETVYIFEDDIVASPFFYKYGKRCIEYYGDKEEIEGISLYSPQWNQNANFPFEPLKTEYDTYFMQYAQSWGQIWFRDKWEKFIEWYLQNIDFFKSEKDPNVPQILYTWGENSWLKYHIAYCALKKKYFVYPYYSYTTTFVESGTHFGTDITRYHASFMIHNIRDFKLAPLKEDAVRYDAFFENMQAGIWLDEKYADVYVDLYGCQSEMSEKRYCLTTRSMPFQVERQFGLQFRPIELNVLLKVEGRGIYLYDTASKKKKIKKKQKEGDIVKLWDYFMKDRFMMWNEILPISRQKFCNLLYIIKKNMK